MAMQYLVLSSIYMMMEPEWEGIEMCQFIYFLYQQNNDISRQDCLWLMHYQFWIVQISNVSVYAIYRILDVVQLVMVAQKGNLSLQFFEVTFCELAVFQFCTFANMQFVNQALLQTSYLSIYIQYPNSRDVQ